MVEFLHMGGYAFYVWTSYAIVLLLLLWHFFLPWFRTRSLLKMLAGNQHRQRNAEKGRK